jgi:hypothetical protein
MVVVPKVRAETTPKEFMVATDELDEVQGLDTAGVPDPVNVVVVPGSFERVPEIEIWVTVP